MTGDKHLEATFRENEKAFKDIMEPYSILLADARDSAERVSVMRRALRETIALRFPLAERRGVVAIDDRQGSLAL